MADDEHKAKKQPLTLAELAQMQATDKDAMQAISEALAEATQESQALMAEFFSFQQRSVPSTLDPSALQAMDSYSAVGKALMTHPERLMQLQLDLWQGYGDLWRSFLTGESEKPSGDRRFSDPEWNLNPFFRLMQKSYELNAKWLMGIVDAATDSGADTADLRKAKFFTQQTVDMMAPTNFFATNPAALRAFIESGGKSVVEGLRQLRHDLHHSQGRVHIQQVDSEPFQVGKNIATTPGKVVFRNPLIEILNFEPVKKKQHAVPLLIFPPFINKFYILDLREENSMIRWLLSKGFNVFLVSWRSADDETKGYTWDDYAEKGIHAALDAVQAITGSDKINTVGYCIGGTLLSTALARLCKKGDERVSSVTYFASQVDFTEAGELLVFADDAAIAQIETIIEAAGGLMPGETMSETFNYLRPIDLVWRYVVDNYMMGKKPKPFDLLFWNADQTNIPGPLHLQYLRELYRDNRFAKGDFTLLGEPVGVSDITIPAFFQSGRADHIVPYKSTYRGARLFSGPKTFVLAGSGHIAGVINHPDAKKYQHWVNEGDMPASADDWIAGAEEHEGSWWPYWAKWLKQYSGDKFEARPVPDKGLGDAPGRYVMDTLAVIAKRRGRRPDYVSSNTP